jgi:hypothetical protein
MSWRKRLRQYEKVPGLLQQLSHATQAMSAPFWWSLQKDSKPADILHNGSICYLDTGASQLGVTADHVLVEYLSDLDTYGTPAVECQFGGSTIKPEDRILAQDRILDIATLSVPEVFVTAAIQNRRMQHKPLNWPPVRIEKDEFVVYGGYPGILRENKVRTADLPFQWIAGGVSDATTHTIVLEPGFETLTWLNPEPNRVFNRDFRGMSGGPVFRVVDDAIVRLELVAVIYEFMFDADSEGNPIGDGHTILARHADCVIADGMLKTF